MKAITGTWNTLTDTFTIVGRYRPHSLYPLFTFLTILLVTFGALIPLFDAVLTPDRHGILGWVLFGVVVYLAYGVLYFISTFGNVMLVRGIAGRLDHDDSRSAGVLFAQTNQSLPLITTFTVVSATLSLISILTRVLIGPLFGGLIAPRVSNKLWMRWHELSYKIPLQLAVPIIALDQPRPRNIFARGESLVKATWGERVKPAHGMGLLTLVALLLVMLYAIPTLQQGLAEQNEDLRRLGMSVVLLVIGVYVQLSALVNAVFALAAYRYATARKQDLFPGNPSYAEDAFLSTQKRKEADATPTAAMTEGTSVVADDLSH